MQETETIKIGALLIMVVVGLLILGGLGATILSIRSARGPRERAHAMGAILAAWALFCVTMGAIYFIESFWRYIVLAVYFLHLPFAIYFTIRRRLLIRVAEERHIPDLRDASGERTMGP